MNKLPNKLDELKSELNIWWELFLVKALYNSLRVLFTILLIWALAALISL